MLQNRGATILKLSVCVHLRYRVKILKKPWADHTKMKLAFCIHHLFIFVFWVFLAHRDQTVQTLAWTVWGLFSDLCSHHHDDAMPEYTLLHPFAVLAWPSQAWGRPPNHPLWITVHSEFSMAIHNSQLISHGQSQFTDNSTCSVNSQLKWAN